MQILLPFKIIPVQTNVPGAQPAISCFEGYALHLPSVFITQVPIVTTHFISSCLFLFLNSNATESSIIFLRRSV